MEVIVLYVHCIGREVQLPMHTHFTPVGRKIAKAGSKLKYTMYTPQPENNYHMYGSHQHTKFVTLPNLLLQVYTVNAEICVGN